MMTVTTTKQLLYFLKMKRLEAGPLRGPRYGFTVALMLVLQMSACGSTPGADSKVVSPAGSPTATSGPEVRDLSEAPTALTPPVGGLVTTLQDEVHNLPEGRIAWSAYWKLCWEEYPGAAAYELQTVTGEGISPKLRRQSEHCFRIEAAKGENEKSQGLVNRDLLLALQAGQLAYRVRAVLADNRTSAWSAAYAVGERIRQ